jgi:hypothetical protein
VARQHWVPGHFVGPHWHAGHFAEALPVAPAQHWHPKHFVGPHFHASHWIGDAAALLPVTEPLDPGGRFFLRRGHWCLLITPHDRCWISYCEVTNHCLKQRQREDEDLLLSGLF